MTVVFSYPRVPRDATRSCPHPPNPDNLSFLFGRHLSSFSCKMNESYSTWNTTRQRGTPSPESEIGSKGFYRAAPSVTSNRCSTVEESPRSTFSPPPSLPPCWLHVALVPLLPTQPPSRGCYFGLSSGTVFYQRRQTAIALSSRSTPWQDRR